MLKTTSLTCTADPAISLQLFGSSPRIHIMSGEGFKPQEPGFATRAIHEAQEPEQWNCRAVVTPLFQSTTFKQDAPGKYRGFEYGRCGNPTRDILEKVLASLDKGKHGLTFSSGLGATTVLASLVNAGDHILAGDDLFGGVSRFYQTVMTRLGVETSFIDMSDLKNLETSFKSNTKMLWLETPSNPLLRVYDLRAICNIAHKKNKDVIVVVDNTFLTSYFQKPLELGADIVMYSLTKYMNGHSDVIMGAAVTKSDSLHERMRFLQNIMGVVPSPFDCLLVNRSLKTLALRMEQHMTNGLAVARFLEKHPLIEKVLHPGLPSHPQHELSKRQCYGHSGMVAFYVKGGLEEATIFFQSLRVVMLAVSLGGCESVAELPSVMTHECIPYEERIKLGITDSLVRLSVGLEDAEVIIKDLDQALNSTVKKCGETLQNSKG